MENIKELISWIHANNQYPPMHTISGGQTTKVMIEGVEKVMFCSNNYLNLSDHPEVKKAVQDATEIYGTGSGGSRLVSGTSDTHRQLERTIADFKGRGDALIFSSGYMTNIGVLGSLANPLGGAFKHMPKDMVAHFMKETVIFSDEYNHASIIDAAKISGVKLFQYKHVDMQHLKAGLKRFQHLRKFIITDGIFSMDGEIAPLKEIVELAETYNASVIVDDAHAAGILGERGMGTAEYLGLKGKIAVEIGTLNKVFGGIGGYVTADKDVCDFLRMNSRTYIFSAAMPPAVAAGLTKAVEIVRDHPEMRNNLIANIKYMKQLLLEDGIPVTDVPAPIIPFITGDEDAAANISAKLFDAGFYIPPIRWPAVSKGKARLRITLMSEHTKEQITDLVKLLSKFTAEEGLTGKITTVS